MTEKPPQGTRLLNTKAVVASLLFGAAIAVAVTVTMCVWEWAENPGGIFRGADGTRWSFVFDTAVSWFVPTFFYAAFVAFLAQLVLRGFGFTGRKYSRSKSPRREP